MGPEEGSLALEKLCGLAFVSRAQGRGGIGMMTTGVSIPLGSFNVPGLLLAAVLAVVLTLSVGAAVLVDWDDIFSDRFGPEGAETGRGRR